MNNIIRPWFRPDMPRPGSSQLFDKVFSLQNDALALEDPEDQELFLGGTLGDYADEQRLLQGSVLRVKCISPTMSIDPRQRSSTVDVTGNFETIDYEFRDGSDGRRDPLVTLIMLNAVVKWPARPMSAPHPEFKIPISTIKSIVNVSNPMV
jgi:hypothetical protein